MSIFEVRGSSMEPLLYSGDTVNVIDGTLPESKHDLIVFKIPDGSQHIKQCIGLPGDDFKVLVDWLYINNSLAFPLLNSSQIFCWTSWSESCNFIIPKDYYIVLGTSLQSNDSRTKGFIFKDDILGLAVKL